MIKLNFKMTDLEKISMKIIWIIFRLMKIVKAQNSEYFLLHVYLYIYGLQTHFNKVSH